MMNNKTNRFDTVSPLLKASDVARKLSISRSLVYKLLKIGAIPTVKIMNSVRVRRSDLDEYIKRQWSGWTNPDYSGRVSNNL